MPQFEELEKGVQQWAGQKGIFEKSGPDLQIDKTQEELDELIEEIKEGGTKRDIELEMGDVLVTLCIQAAMQGTSLSHCLEQALNKITKRKGKMVNGLFVKEAS